MSDSLIIANQIELIGEVPSTNPKCLGAIFRLTSATAGNLDLGAPQPTTDFVASLLLDGERPFGRRSSNRTIKLPISINAASPLLLAGALEVLQSAVDQDMWILQWIRDPWGGTPLPVLFDCFRAQPSVPVYNLIDQAQSFAQILLTIPALPYGRSNVREQLAFASPVPASPPPPPAPVVLDNYSTIATEQFQQSSQCIAGPRSGFWDPDSFGDPGGQVTPLTYSAVFASTLNLTSMTSLQFYLGLGTRYYHNLEHHGQTEGVAITITLQDSFGNTLSMTRNNLRVPVAPVVTSPCFTQVTVPIPQRSPTFAYNSVVAYSLQITNRQDNGLPRFSWVSAYIDALTAYPSTQTVQPVSRGNVYTIYGLIGTARALMALSIQQLPSAGTATTITATGIGSYTVPALTAYIKAEAWASGGPGASEAGAGLGGGGGSGGYSRENVFPCAPGDVIPYSVGAGGTPGNNGAATYIGPGPASPLVVTANPGQAAAPNSSTGGLGGVTSGNSVSFPGAQGRTASGSVGGGGASSAGPTSAGLSPVGAAAVILTGSGNWVAPAGVTQVYVECWGPGGSGANGSSGTNGGGGGGGEYVAAFVTVVPGNSFAYACPAGGALVNGNGINGNPGAGPTTFAGANGSVVAFNGLAGLARGAIGGSGLGGQGGSFSGGPYVEYPGGNGGPSQPYSGSGGSSAGPGAAGNNGSGYGGSTPAPAGGGAGGAGSGATGNNGSAGSSPGGGGGGTYFNNVNSGAGIAGQIRITYPGGAPTNNGAAAVSGGGAGGNGGGSANTPGSNGSSPGGGGGGADSGGSVESAGNGGNGQLVVTPYSSAAFKTLIVHRPPLGCSVNFQPSVSVGAGSDAPDGTHLYTMPQPVAGVAADFGGTYTIYLINKTWNGSGSRTVTVTVTQNESVGGASHATSTIPVTFTPSQITNGILTAGVLTLPVWKLAPDNVGAYYTVSVTDTNTADRFYDCIFLDTQGQSVIINEPTTGYPYYYIDIPDSNVNLGNIMGSQSGRPNAISVLDHTFVSGVTPYLEPADCENQLFVYSVDAAAGIAISVEYYPHWFFDRYQ